MNVIKGLVIKDFQTIKSYKGTALFMLVIFVGSSFLNNNITNFLPIFMPLYFGMLAISSFSYDNLAKADKYILTFPINKKDVVRARYIYILLVTLVGSLLGYILTILVQCIKLGNILDIGAIVNNLAVIIGSLLGIMFLQSFQIPIMYKFGAEKGRIIQMIMVVGLMLGISIITTVLMKIFGISLDTLIAILKNYLIVIIGAAVVLLYISSYITSCKIYEKKEI